MKQILIFCCLPILLLSIGCFNDKIIKDEIIQHPIVLVEDIQEAPQIERGLLAPIKVSIRKVLQEEQVPAEAVLEYGPFPEPPPPPPEPEVEIFIVEKTIEEKWQAVINLPKYQRTRRDMVVGCNYGDSLVKQERYEEAIEVYQKTIELIRTSNSGEIYFSIARAYALQGNDKHTYYYNDVKKYLERAKFEGFRDYKALLYEEAFEEYREWNRFFKNYKKLFKDNQAAMFEAFIAFAPKKELIEAYDLNPVNLFENIDRTYKYYKEHPAIYTYFDVFAKGAETNSFGRGGRSNCRYEMCLAGTKHYFVVIYSVEEQWSEYILPKKYCLVTYDLKGNKISELEIAKRGSLKTCKGFILHPNNNLVVTNYAIKWKKGAKKSWRNKNFLYNEYLKKTIVKSTYSYQITDFGRLVEMGNSDQLSLGMR